MEKMQKLMKKDDRKTRSRSRSKTRYRSSARRSRSKTPRRRRTRSRSRSPVRRRRTRSRTPERRNRRDEPAIGSKFAQACNVTVMSPSESTIYNPAVKPNFRVSTSSEDPIYSSDEEFFPSKDLGFVSQPRSIHVTGNSRGAGADKAGTSRYGSETGNRPQQRLRTGQCDQPTPEQRAEDMVREAEAAKIRMMEVAGRNEVVNVNCDYVHSAMVDENFLLVAAHVEDNLRLKIEKGDYVDFARLLPNDRVMQESDNRMEWVQEGGNTFLAPVGWRSNKEKGGITSFSKWEQAFRVYSDIYCRAHPDRSAQLIQYNHIIGTASATYIWDNVYQYDCHFRVHMARNPARSWGIILQQAWAMYLKDKHKLDFGSNNKSERRNKACWRFNIGKCSYGNTCKFEHRCFACNKFGHGSHNCRKLQDKGGESGRYNDRKQDYDRRDKNRGGGGART